MMRQFPSPATLPNESICAEPLVSGKLSGVIVALAKHTYQYVILKFSVGSQRNVSQTVRYCLLYYFSFLVSFSVFSFQRRIVPRQVRDIPQRNKGRRTYLLAFRRRFCLFLFLVPSSAVDELLPNVLHSVLKLCELRHAIESLARQKQQVRQLGRSFERQK